MSLPSELARLQAKATAISPPGGTAICRAQGGLRGPAFFPEGLGLSASVLSSGAKPTVMAVGHNFGCVAYRREIDQQSREDDKATWRNLDTLLLQAGLRPELCFRTNWFIGLLPGDRQLGKFLRRPDREYEDACRDLLVHQITLIRPRAILFLGPESAGRAYQLAPALIPWRSPKRWADIDRSELGHSVRNVSIPAANHVANVAALLHPSFGLANQARRMKNMLRPETEAEIVRASLGV